MICTGLHQTTSSQTLALNLSTQTGRIALRAPVNLRRIPRIIVCVPVHCVVWVLQNPLPKIRIQHSGRTLNRVFWIRIRFRVLQDAQFGQTCVDRVIVEFRSRCSRQLILVVVGVVRWVSIAHFRLVRIHRVIFASAWLWILFVGIIIPVEQIKRLLHWFIKEIKHKPHIDRLLNFHNRLDIPRGRINHTGV